MGRNATIFMASRWRGEAMVTVSPGISVTVASVSDDGEGIHGFALLFSQLGGRSRSFAS